MLRRNYNILIVSCTMPQEECFPSRCETFIETQFLPHLITLFTSYFASLDETMYPAVIVAIFVTRFVEAKNTGRKRCDF